MTNITAFLILESKGPFKNDVSGVRRKGVQKISD